MATTTTTTTPWSAQQPYLERTFAEAGRLAATPRHFFPGNTYVGFSPQSEAALGLTQQRALGGSPYEAAMGNYLAQAMGHGQIDLSRSALSAQQMQRGINTGQDALQQTAGGGMLGSNPYLDQQFGAASDALTRQYEQSVMPGINATFGGGGRTGSGAHQQAMANSQQALGNQLGNMGAQIYGGAYESERDRQMGAASTLQDVGLGGIGALGDMYSGIDQSRARAGALAPTMAGLEYGNIDRLAGVGQAVSGQQRDILQDQMNRFSFYQDTPYNNLNWYANLVGGQNYGGMQSVDSGTNRFGTALGGAMAGAGVGSAFGPWGTGIGAGIGLLGGLFS